MRILLFVLFSLVFSTFVFAKTIESAEADSFQGVMLIDFETQAALDYRLDFPSDSLPDSFAMIHSNLFVPEGMPVIDFHSAPALDPVMENGAHITGMDMAAGIGALLLVVFLLIGRSRKKYSL